MKRKFKHKAFIIITDILIKTWLTSLAVLAFVGWLTLVFGFISGDIDVPSFGTYR